MNVHSSNTLKKGGKKNETTGRMRKVKHLKLKSL